MKKLMYSLFCLAFVLAGCGRSDPQAGKKLVVYFSAADDGIAEIADMVADKAGADVFEIVPDDSYTLHQRTTDFKLEQAVPDNWDDYETVYIGGPSWGGLADTPVSLFVSQNNISGKHFHPFTIGTQKTAEDICDQLSGYGAHEGWSDPKGFSKSATAADVEEWVESTSQQQ